MKLNQAWAWLLAGVVAAGLNASYHDGGLQWAHQAIDQVGYNAGAVLALASGRVDQFAAQTRMVSARNETASCRFATALGHLQTKIARIEMARQHSPFDRIQVMNAEHEAQLAKLEANRARMEAGLATLQIPSVAFTRAAFNPVAFNNVEVSTACSRVRVSVPHVSIPRVTVQRIPMLKIPAPVVNIDIPGAGPV